MIENTVFVFGAGYRDGLPVFGVFMWHDQDGQMWELHGSAEDLPQKQKDDLLRDHLTPLEKLINA